VVFLKKIFFFFFFFLGIDYFGGGGGGPTITKVRHAATGVRGHYVCGWRRRRGCALRGTALVTTRGESEKIAAYEVPRQCPFVLLVKGGW